MISQGGTLPRNAAEFVVYEWIGVEQGQLLEFTHSQLTSFFQRYADLPESHPGVLNDAGPLEGYGTPKRERFIQALDHGSPLQQAAILRGILQRLPVDPAKDRSQEKADKIHGWIQELEQKIRVGDVEVDDSTTPIPDVANEALRVAREHMAQGDHHLALDRVHTALHGCVKRLVQETGFDTEKNDKLRDQFGAVRKNHPAFRIEHGDRAAGDVLQGIARTLDGLNAARNKHTLVHPNDDLLAGPEARLMCNAGITVLQYILDRSDAYASGAEEQLETTTRTPSTTEPSNLHDPFASFDWPADAHSNSSS